MDTANRNAGSSTVSRNKGACAYIIAMLFSFALGIVLTPKLSNRNIALQKQARNFLIIIGTGLLLMGGWLVIQCFVKSNSVGPQPTIHIVMFWLSHVLLYVLVGYYSPSLLFYAIGCGLLWEFFECHTWRWNKTSIRIVCNGRPDLIANILGLSLGVACRILRSKTVL